MRDALGGTVVITLIAIFTVAVMSYMAFNVNYTKAFRMKDYIITVYDERNGDCYGVGECEDLINNYAKQIGYNPRSFDCPSGSQDSRGIYCITKKVQTLEESDSEYNDIKTKVYYSIQTKIDIRMPIIDNWLSTKVFMVTGNTKAYDEKVVKDD